MQKELQAINTKLKFLINSNKYLKERFYIEGEDDNSFIVSDNKTNWKTIDIWINRPANNTFIYRLLDDKSYFWDRQSKNSNRVFKFCEQHLLKQIL